MVRRPTIALVEGAHVTRPILPSVHDGAAKLRDPAERRARKEVET
ncbi:MAG TPA: hypothetical protein VM889_11380 [Candidatus Thermoplasmatota archaeon]|nr:hypothetical protein [Candidatus Thermoplasmatota archaeon]